MLAPASSVESRGTQSIERAVRLLRELAARGGAGWRLGDLAVQCELDRTTVHRILRCLIDERLVHQRASDRHYVIGWLNHELGLSVPGAAELGDEVRLVFRRLLRQLPRMTALSSFLRSGNDAVCFARAGAASHITDATRPRVGQRMPLLSVTGGLALIAALQADAADAVRADGRRKLAHRGETYLKAADAMVKAARRDGYVVSASEVWAGVNSIAMAFGPPGAPAGSLVVSASASDYNVTAMKAMVPALRIAAAALTRHAGQAGLLIE